MQAIKNWSWEGLGIWVFWLYRRSYPPQLHFCGLTPMYFSKSDLPSKMCLIYWSMKNPTWMIIQLTNVDFHISGLDTSIWDNFYQNKLTSPQQLLLFLATPMHTRYKHSKKKCKPYISYIQSWNSKYRSNLKF